MLPITVPQHVFESLQEQIANCYVSWDSFVESYIDESDTPPLLSDIINNKLFNDWNIKIAHEYTIDELIIFPTCEYLNGTTDFFLYNLELVKIIEYKEAKANVYKKIIKDDPAYVLCFTKDAAHTFSAECNDATLFKI